MANLNSNKRLKYTVNELNILMSMLLTSICAEDELDYETCMICKRIFNSLMTLATEDTDFTDEMLKAAQERIEELETQGFTDSILESANSIRESVAKENMN